MVGRIIKNISNDYTVLVNDKRVVCKPRGVFRNQNITPLVGDFVKIDENNIITEIETRKNELIRPPISNIDNALIITSLVSPDLNLNLLDKMINIIEFNNIKPILIFTKIDLLDDKNKYNDILDYYKKIGYEVYLNTELDSIKNIFKDKFTILTGQTGVGKSTLINKLDSSLKLNTGEISIALGRGRHTTRHCEAFNLYDGFVIDTPGFSSLDFNDMTKEDIRDNFIEFEKYKDKCKYKDCMHILDDDCEVKKEVNKNILNSRYENYVKFIESKKGDVLWKKQK